MKTVCQLSLFAAFISCLTTTTVSAADTVATPKSTPPAIFDVTKFGAKGDGTTLDTDAIQKALDACDKAGGGIVELPKGTYLSKPIFLHSNLTLQLDDGALLQARDLSADFANPAGRGVIAFINASNLTNISITGKGRIDGAGARWWPPVKLAKKNNTPEPEVRPRLIVIANCKKVRIQDVTLTNSPSFHLVPRDCEDVVIQGVTIRAPADSPNTDAIDPSTCQRILITKCILDVGDDNVAIKSGHNDPVHPNAACADIIVSDCTMLHGHGMSIGSETNGGVSNMTVSNCTFQDTVSGIRIKSDRTRGGLVSNITYRDLTMHNVHNPILITSYYPNIPATDTAQPVTDRTPTYRDIHIINVTGDSPAAAGSIVGLPEMSAENITLDNVQLTAATGLTLRNAKGVQFTKVKIEVKKGPAVVVQGNVTITGPDAPSPASTPSLQGTVNP
jgi:polygalacturonase